MKKALLITIEDQSNIGNRLQHYALQTSIENCGFHVESLMIKQYAKNTIKTRIKRIIKESLAKLGIKKYIRGINKENRSKALRSFNEKYISKIIRMRYADLWQANWDWYSVAVTGSDQVWHNWHTATIPNELSFYYLEFINKEKRVSYAPSFGFTAFPEEDIEAHKVGLTEIRALSCREKEGCELIKELTGRSAIKVLDPTLLLTPDIWENIESRPSFTVPDQYLLLFFLGTITDKYRNEIDRIAALQGLSILNINNIEDTKHYSISPNEFIWLIHHADTVCTDSFHASVFSILFERKLRVFQRKQAGFEDMFGRLRDLLTLLGLMENAYDEGDHLETKLDDNRRKALQREREASLEYLKESLA